MVYASYDELRASLTPLGGTGRTAAGLDDARLTAAIEDAELEVDAAVSRYFTLPADGDTPPTMLKTLTLHVAAYLATLEARGGQDLDDNDPIARRYAWARRLLDGIETGLVHVPGLDPAPAGEGGAAAYGFDFAPPVGLTEDVSAPTYGGGTPVGWRGAPPAWPGGTSSWPR